MDLYVVTKYEYLYYLNVRSKVEAIGVFTNKKEAVACAKECYLKIVDKYGFVDEGNCAMVNDEKNGDYDISNGEQEVSILIKVNKAELGGD